MEIIKNKQPVLNKPEFKVDNPISKYLDDDPLLKYMNKSFCCGLISKGGGGKTSFLISLLNTKHKFKKIFHHIYIWMPSSSRDSMKNNVFDALPDEQKFEGVSFENLNDVYNRLLESTKKKELSLLIFDDVQSYFNNIEVATKLLHIISNKRHLRSSLFIVAQNYLKIPKQIRQVLSDIFIWNISKEQYLTIYDELLTMPKQQFKMILKEFKKEKEINKHSFLYFNDIYKIFINWNELIFNDEF